MTADMSSVRFVFPAAVGSIDEQRARDLTELLNARAADPSIFKDHPPVFFSARISSSAIDSYYTRMMPSSLRNFANDARSGISFQDSHKHDQLGIGQTLDGRYVETAQGSHVEADIFTLGGLPDLDGFIHRLRAGIARDVSMGFTDAKHMCSICGRDMWQDMDCQHIPGIEYDIPSGDEGQFTRQKALALIENARAVEVSAVFDGATPGCAIYKARLEAEAGRMSPRVARILRDRYRSIDMPFITDILKSPVSLSKQRGEAMPAKKRDAAVIIQHDDEPTELIIPPVITAPPEPTEEEPDTEKEKELELKAADDAAPAPAISANESAALNATLEAAEVSAAGRANRAQGLSELLVLAKEGREYRRSLHAEVLAEGVRLFGQGFKPETYEPFLRSGSIESIRAVRDDWAKRASLKYPGGRQTAEITNEQPKAFELPANIWG